MFAYSMSMSTWSQIAIICSYATKRYCDYGKIQKIAIYCHHPFLIWYFLTFGCVSSMLSLISLQTTNKPGRKRLQFICRTLSINAVNMMYYHSSLFAIFMNIAFFFFLVSSFFSPFLFFLEYYHILRKHYLIACTQTVGIL